MSISRFRLSCARDEMYTGAADTSVAEATTPASTLARSHRLFATRLRTRPRIVRECIV